MEVLKEVVNSGLFSVIDLILFAIIGILLYLMNVKRTNSESNIHDTITGMQALLEEERIQTQALSKTVYEIRKEVEREKNKNYELREEILTLKSENMRLQNLVTQMEGLVKQYQEELEKYKKGE